MIRRLCLCLFVCLAAFAGFPERAHAHPHVWVTVKSTVEYENGLPAAVHHVWRFDDMFSAFAVQGLDANGDGKLSREELADLAEVNVQSLGEFDFFTFAKSGGEDASFQPPRDYWLEHDGTALTLHFTLPVASAPAAARDGLRVEVYDPTFFVAFAFAEKGAAALRGAPDTCRIEAKAPDVSAQTNADEPLSEDFFNQLSAGSDFGEQFANVLTVRCGENGDVAVAAAAPAPPPDGGNGTVARSDTPAGTAASRVEQAQDVAASAGPIAPAASQTQNGALGAFGVVRPDGAGSGVPRDGFFGWVARQQSSFYQSMSGALAASKADGSAFLLLGALAFAYGVLHAAGPGHGKAVISSYLVATGETLRRGLAISFAAAIAQAVTAIAVVGIFAGLLGVTSRDMGVAAWWLEFGSYVLIALVGLNLAVRRGSRLVASLRGRTTPVDHACGDDCGHAHMPEPLQLTGPFNWRRAATAVLAIGLRPCTGALLILVFSMAQGLVWAGVAATFAMALGTAITVSAIAALAVWAKGLALRLASSSSGTAGRVVGQGIEVAAGLAVLAFGTTLLLGLMLGGAPIS
jgi:nickel/cobalt transporter (NicO) family protein